VRLGAGRTATSAGARQRDEREQQEQQAQSARRADPFGGQNASGHDFLVIAGRHAI
jgi:hypothetical protein